jgi:mersacidin/lichenicidin family type 2 lantibiotic
MSTEEIIDAWKHNEEDSKGKQQASAKKAPVNPAGEQEISDEDLQAVEGGRESSCGIFSCGS